MVDVFPFNLIERGSIILMYGLGSCGGTYYEQNKQLKWCHVKYVSDKAKPAGKEFRDIYILPENISEIISEVDKIVIGISHPAIAKQVRKWMIGNNIDENMIVSPVLEEDGMCAELLWDDATKGGKHRILLGMGGGLGDYVVFLSFYQKLMDYLPNAEIIIQGRMSLLDVVYGQKKNVTIIPQNVEVKNQNQFDCILELKHYIKVIWCDHICMPKELVRKFEEYETEYERKYSAHEMRDEVFIRRMIIAGRNRYDALGGGRVFELGKVKLKIDYTENAKDRYNKYNLEQYVTFNYGSDRIRNATEEQMKVWPKGHYEEWISQFKKQYPNIEVIQIGAEDATVIKGADRHILGEEFEVVKYILKNALFHLDCEGGLVHLATAIGTKCIVLFGPTPLKYYAYPQNVNIHTGVCEGCMDLSDNWPYECINNKRQCCMYSITPEMVMKNINYITKNK